ncbi:MAG TPA: oligosaccharide flippase family protein, partial [Povalibacter sp.]|nr:oligosaccharide flippase family protein [Povalibacter sp.]
MSASPDILHRQPAPAHEVSGAGMTARELDRRATSSLVWQAGKIAVHLLQYVVLARLVAPEEFGKFALAAPLFLVLSAVNDGGLSTATVTGRRYNRRLASSLWWTQVAMGVAMAAVMVLSSPLLVAMFRVPDLLGVGAGLAISLLIESWGLQSRANLRRDMRIGALALVEIGGLVLGVISALVASHWTHGVALVVLAQIVNAIGRTVIGIALAPLRPRGFTVSDEYRTALRTGWNVVGSDLLNIMRAQCPTLVIGFFLVLNEVGLFSRANQLLNVPLTLLAPAMANFLLPLL